MCSCGDTTPLGTNPVNSTDGGITTDVGGSRCEDPDFIECDGTCLDPRADHHNCGECGRVCQDSHICEQGQCTQIKCDLLETICDRQCVDTDHHRDHCGQCGNRCYPDEVCTRGECLAECSHDLTRCGSHCVNLEADPNHCGLCNYQCEPEETCLSGECRADRCPEGLTDCYGGCVNIQVDNNHCGLCGHQCPGDHICWAATCILDCQEGLTHCDSSCIDTDTDTKHCGGCYQACSPGEICKNGECFLTCQEGLTNCMGVCTNLQTDRTNCGFCTNHCLDGQVCVRGECSLNCPSGLDKCDDNCVNIHTDRFNCGECGLTCSGGQVCSFGRCETTCPQGQTPCGDVCSTLDRDDFNCGECGEICPEGYACTGGRCEVACPAGYLTCDGVCVDTGTHNNHCGGCGEKCPPGATCRSGQCAVPVSGLSIRPVVAQVNVGEQSLLTATITPEGATDRTLIWSSSHPQVATVNNNGAVTGVNSGQTLITAVSRDGDYLATCTVTVTIPVATVTVIPDTLYLMPEQGATLQVLVLPEDASNPGVIWTSSHPSIATVDSARRVQAGSSLGNTTITATTEDGGKQAGALVSVNTTPATGVAIEPPVITILPGEQAELVARVLPENASNRGVLWHSSDPFAVSINNQGVITGLTVGESTITAITMDGGYTGTAQVLSGVAVTGVEVNPTALYLPLGAQSTLTHQIFPEDATFKEVTWSTNNPAVATVSQTGEVTGLTLGQATITVTTANGEFSASSTVTVLNPATGLEVEPTSHQMGSGDTLTIRAIISPPQAGAQTVTWTSSDPSVATVTETGATTTVTALKTGHSTITGAVENSDLTATTTVQVGLYQFTSHTFTNCNQTGYTGPTYNSCRSVYSTPWAGNTNLYNVSNGIQTWTVPDTGTYRIQAKGAQGSNNQNGGLGASMTGEFELEMNQQLRIIVGQRGTGSNNGGGGGASVVSIGTISPLIVAGGGGGSGSNCSNSPHHGTIENNGRSGGGSGAAAGGTNGNGGTGSNGGGGGGWHSNGGTYNARGGTRLNNTATGGANNNYGGFGGGGAGYSESWFRNGGGGGGGGYSGGGGGSSGCGGGGGSYNSGTNQVNLPGANSGQGTVTITKVQTTP